MSYQSRVLAMTVLLSAFAQPARAQVGFEGLLGSINDVAVSFTCWTTVRTEELEETEGCPSEKNGYGVEVIFNLGTVYFKKTRPDRVEMGKEERKIDGTTESVVTHVPKTNSDSMNRGLGVLLELGLGYAQFTGFRSSDPAYTIRGTARELPAVAVYGSLVGNGVLKHLVPYLAVRSGLIGLHNVQLFDQIAPDSVIPFAASAQAFQLGGGGGIAIGVDRTFLFFEAVYNLRRLPSVQWAAPGINRIPSNFPRELDFTGWSITGGVQITIRPRP